MAKDYNKTLQKALKMYFTQEQIDEFEWHNDKETDTIYQFSFYDHNKNPRNLVMLKETGTISLK